MMLLLPTESEVSTIFFLLFHSFLPLLPLLPSSPLIAGTWYYILEVIAYAAVITNSALVAFTGGYFIRFKTIVCRACQYWPLCCLTLTLLLL